MSRKLFSRRTHDYSLVTHVASALFGVTIGVFLHSQFTSMVDWKQCTYSCVKNR